jgi:hypothetical protein
MVGRAYLSRGTGFWRGCLGYLGRAFGIFWDNRGGDMATYRISYRTPCGSFEYWEDAARAVVEQEHAGGHSYRAGVV